MYRIYRFVLIGFCSQLSAFPQPPSASTAGSPSASSASQAPIAVGTADPERFFELFRPFRTTNAALSPDGKLIAYSVREGEELFVFIVDVDNPAKGRAKVLVGTDDTSTGALKQSAKEKTPARIRWMGWANSNRLVIETNVNLALNSGGSWQNTAGAIFAIDADGKNGKNIVTPKDVEAMKGGEFTAKRESNDLLVTTPDQEPPPIENSSSGLSVNSDETAEENNLPLDVRYPRSPTFFDFDPKNPDSIIVRTSDQREYGLYTINVNTGKLSYGPDARVTGDLNVLINRQGQQAAAIASTVATSFPHKYLIEKKSGLGRWSDLSDIAKTPSANFSVSPETYFGQRSFPIGFDEAPNILYYASNVGRDTYGIYSLDLKTGERIGKPIESPSIDLVDPAPNGFLSPNPLVFDRYTRKLVGIRYRHSIASAIWLRADLQEVQKFLEGTFPGRSVDLTSWDEQGKRFLANVRGPTDSGGFYIVERETGKVSEFIRSAPWISAEVSSASMNVSIPNPAGGKITGVLVIPRAVRQKPIPIVVFCADEPWQRAPVEFDTEMNAISRMGFAVLQINPRGVWGSGIKHRQTIGEAFDETQVQDIVTAIDAITKSMPILNSKRVALLGHDRGGYLALRALQLRPDRFRCAVGIDPTIDLKSWLGESRWTTGASGPALTRAFFGEKVIKQNALLDNPKSITKPIFLLSYRGPDGGPSPQQYRDARRLVGAVETPEVPARLFDLTTDYMEGLPQARSEALRNIEDFLNEQIYAYNVKMGNAEVIEEKPSEPQPKK
jgi:dipeptidyl aminopeptidase/acylaminoacyl peptidase